MAPRHGMAWRWIRAGLGDKTLRRGLGTIVVMDLSVMGSILRGL